MSDCVVASASRRTPAGFGYGRLQSNAAMGRVTTEGSPHVNLGQSSESQMRLGAPWNTQSRRPQLKRQNAIMRNDLRFMSYGEKPYEIELLECNLQRIWNDKHERTFYGYPVLGENIVATRRNKEELLIIDCAYGYLNTLARVKDYGEKSNGTIIRLRENERKNWKIFIKHWGTIWMTYMMTPEYYYDCTSRESDKNRIKSMPVASGVITYMEIEN